MSRLRCLATVELSTRLPGGIRFSAACPLRSPNMWQGRHWRAKDRETKQWEALLLHAAPLQLPGAVLAWRALALTPQEWHAAPERRCVLVTRCTATRQRFIRDADNLRFATKPLNDALKRMGLIYDDSERWLEQSMPAQEISEDGQDRTVIEIGPVKEQP